MEECLQAKVLYENKEKDNKDVNNFSQISLIKSIKSLFIIKKLFSHLTEIKKLELLIYNKHFQNKLGIDLEYYKKISGRYKKGGKNGFGKEYKLLEDISILIYKGEYKNGKRNGKGKEYDNGRLMYEGEFSEGKKIGKGKEYYDNRKIFSNLSNLIKNEFLYNFDEIDIINKSKANNKIQQIIETYRLEFNSIIIIFEVEYINGKKYKGNIKKYNDYGQLIFEG